MRFWISSYEIYSSKRTQVASNCTQNIHQDGGWKIWEIIPLQKVRETQYLPIKSQFSWRQIFRTFIVILQLQKLCWGSVTFWWGSWSNSVPDSFQSSVSRIQLFADFLNFFIIIFKHQFSPLNTFEKRKDPDSYIWLIDPYPGSPKTCGSGSLLKSLNYTATNSNWNPGAWEKWPVTDSRDLTSREEVWADEVAAVSISEVVEDTVSVSLQKENI